MDNWLITPHERMINMAHVVEVRASETVRGITLVLVCAGAPALMVDGDDAMAVLAWIEARAHICTPADTKGE